jgi:hypothetical protein
MDDLFPLLMLLIFVLGPILEGLKRKNKQPPPPAQRRMPPRAAERQLPPAPSRTEEVSSRPREENAATMVPDDLWEILTGQKRPPVLTTPQPAPPVETKRSSWDVVYDPDEEEEEADEEVLVVEDVNVETRRARGEPRSLETLDRHPQPVVISLEENLPTVAQRHEAFHKKITMPVPPPTPTPTPKRPFLSFSDRAELQRAFLMQEVLGRPKGLD